MSFWIVIASVVVTFICLHNCAHPYYRNNDFLYIRRVTLLNSQFLWDWLQDQPKLCPLGGKIFYRQFINGKNLFTQRKPAYGRSFVVLDRRYWSMRAHALSMRAHALIRTSKQHTSELICLCNINKFLLLKNSAHVIHVDTLSQ